MKRLILFGKKPWGIEWRFQFKWLGPKGCVGGVSVGVSYKLKNEKKESCLSKKVFQILQNIMNIWGPWDGSKTEHLGQELFTLAQLIIGSTIPLVYSMSFDCTKKLNCLPCSKLVISVTEHLVEVVDKLSTTAVFFFRSERILKCKRLYWAAFLGPI